MAMNKVQFQPGLSMIEFMDRYGSDDKCEAALVESRWPAGFTCPACCSAGEKGRLNSLSPARLQQLRLQLPALEHRVL